MLTRNRLAFLLLLFISCLLVFGYFQKKEVEIPKPTLRSTVEQTLAGSKGKYGIVIKNFKSGESYKTNEHQSFEAGSLYKLWVAATVFGKIKEEVIKEDDVLTEDISVLNEIFDIASESAELKKGAISLTVSSALNQMITISHNYAALLLIKNIKRSNILKLLEKYEFKESVLGDPSKTTPSDIALFLEKLYQGNIVDMDSSQKIVELLKKQKLNDGLTKYLPEGIQVAHKTGEIGFFKHDAGIVYSSNGDYIIVTLSQSDYPPGAQERIAILSKAVFDYFSLLNK